MAQADAQGLLSTPDMSKHTANECQRRGKGERKVEERKKGEVCVCVGEEEYPNLDISYVPTHGYT